MNVECTNRPIGRAI